MTANGERLSAVARRRRLRDAQLATPSPPAAAPVDEHESSQSASRAASPPSSDAKLESQPVGTSNQFSALVDAAAVRFSFTKEVDQLSETSVKIRLSRGQKCVVLGACTLWVKQGSVFLYGATINASTAVHRIYAPNNHALPAIEALSLKAEFQLDSLENGLIDLPSIGARDMWTPANVERSASSFYVLGHSFDHDPRAPRRSRELDLVPWKSTISSLVPSDDAVSSTTSPPRILLCGRRCSGVSTLARCLLNRILTKQGANFRNARPAGALILDLDTNMPEFAPPGTISLVHVSEPLFGPSFTHMLGRGRHTSRILKMQFLGDLQFTDVCDWHITQILDLLELARQHCSEHQGIPVIVLAPKWWNNIELQLARQLWTKIAPTNIVCLDTSPTSPHLQPWKSLAESGQCQIQQIPSQVFDKVHAAREYDLQMQSYFHLVDSSINRAFWNDMPILGGTYHEVSLTYGGDDAKVGAIILLGGHVAPEDTYDVLEGNLVAIVAVKHPRDKRLNSTRNDSEGSNNDHQHSDSDSPPPCVSRTQEGLPRSRGSMQSLSSILGEHSCCVALAIVVKIDIPNRHIVVVNGQGLHDVEALTQGDQVALVLQKATSDGRFKTDWVRKELRPGGKG
ncbi:hypothetical protein A1O1_03184 [Capronia coronata CBS 617.96]|uniref:Polynucleotide 5'-hydroxyl-kinase GRC3 n=1 Tax=Capronia coronata CBS 617.96 TaxID=1182541 RepID=W9YZQ3_9EURO|nr:uncharacterized protein A1O1_03184 [Capronia coronata CBS 617.96]EXJ94786.1 hypothetical protein A1O1_03184 [Capronia coronata CBS 617.96]